MKVSIVVIIAALVGVIGYLMGTEDGRERRDSLIARCRGASDSAVDTAKDKVADAGDKVADAGDKVADAAKELAS